MAYPIHASCPVLPPLQLLIQTPPWAWQEAAWPRCIQGQPGGVLHGPSVPADLGSSSVRAGLQSLETSGQLEDEFDMFALTRGSSLAEQRKE